MDRLRQIEIFIATVQHGSIAAAGRELELSPAMTGKYLSALESTLGTRLLHRTTRSLSLTDAGQRYLSASKEILDVLAEADAEASESQKQLAGPIRMSVPRAFGMQKLAPVLTAFQRSHPQVILDLYTDERYADLVDGQLDLAVRIGQLADSALHARHMGRIAMGVFCAPGLLVPRERRDYTLICGLPRLVFTSAQSPGDWTVYDSTDRARVINGPVAMRSDDVTLLVRAAIDGLGILYAPMFTAGDALADGRLVQLLDNHRTTDLDLQVIYNDRRHQPARVRVLIDYLAACFQDTSCTESPVQPPT